MCYKLTNFIDISLFLRVICILTCKRHLKLLYNVLLTMMMWSIMMLLTRLTQMNNSLSNLILTMIWVKLIQERKPTRGCIGTTLVANISCQAGHAFRFCSSHEVNQMYVNNIQVAAAVLLSGNNFGKVKRLAESMNLAFVSKSSYFRILIFCQQWMSDGGWMRGQLMDEFRGQKVVCSGNGQCDSPGFSAKNLCYFIMEVTSKYILQVQIVDKRHVGLVSSNMEVEGLKKSLKKLQEDLNVVELVTDASSSVKKLLGRLKLTN